MLDTSLPHIPVVMTCQSPGSAPHFSLPEGYVLRPWAPGLERAWCEIETACGEFPNTGSAMEHFSWEFLPFPEALAKGMWFALAPDGSPAGTVTLWHGTHLGRDLPRIHWVATHPAHEGKGVAKGLLSFVMERCAGPLYLTTQTWSWPAVRLYRRMGFVPYLERPASWKGEWAPDAGWRIIEEKIAACEGR